MDTTTSSPFRQDGYPVAHDLYLPEFEHENCGVGFVASIKGERSHQIVDDADRILRHMTHRGACGCEENTGDGAGILTGLPETFLRKVALSDLGVELPAQGKFAAGVVFLPRDEQRRSYCKQMVNELIVQQGQQLIGWRLLPVDPDAADIGPTARTCMPHKEMLFIGAADGLDQAAFERQLFLIRKNSSNTLRKAEEHPEALLFYICSLTTEVLIYKGMMTPHQVLPYYKDLQDPDYATHLAMVHSRFSTNTLPSWDRAQPCRYMAHNGEINTLRGNKNWVFARQGLMNSDLFGDELEKLFPVAESHCSDSGTFDNVLEMLVQSGRSLPEAIMMMIPEAWQNHHSMPEGKRAFYEYHSALQEPWDGPAALCFTEGKIIGFGLLHQRACDWCHSGPQRFASEPVLCHP